MGKAKPMDRPFTRTLERQYYVGDGASHGEDVVNQEQAKARRVAGAAPVALKTPHTFRPTRRSVSSTCRTVAVTRRTALANTDRSSSSLTASSRVSVWLNLRCLIPPRCSRSGTMTSALNIEGRSSAWVGHIRIEGPQAIVLKPEDGGAGRRSPL